MLLNSTVVHFLDEETFGSTVEFQTATNMTFPNITVCHSRYFDTARMEGRQYNEPKMSFNS